MWGAYERDVWIIRSRFQNQTFLGVFDGALKFLRVGSGVGWDALLRSRLWAVRHWENANDVQR